MVREHIANNVTLSPCFLFFCFHMILHYTSCDVGKTTKP